MSFRLTHTMTNAASTPTIKSRIFGPATITQNKKKPMKRTNAARAAIRTGLALAIERTPQDVVGFQEMVMWSQCLLRIRLYWRETGEQVVREQRCVNAMFGCECRQNRLKVSLWPAD
jgi:hypothetical protein